MSDWISAQDRKEFEAWRDNVKLQAADDALATVLRLTKYRLDIVDSATLAQIVVVTAETEKLYKLLRGRS